MKEKYNNVYLAACIDQVKKYLKTSVYERARQWTLIYLTKILGQKNLIKMINKTLLSFKIKSAVLLLKFFTNFSKIDEKLGENSGNCE